ncbi:hypothetical protein [Saccharothrix stipae]
MLRSKWITGPEADFAGPALVSVTEFTLDRIRRTPGAYRAGFTSSREWPGLSGSTGSSGSRALPRQAEDVDPHVIWRTAGRWLRDRDRNHG